MKWKDTKQTPILKRSKQYDDFSTIHIKDVDEKLVYKHLCRVLVTSFSVLMVIVLVACVASFQKRQDHRDILLSMGFSQLVPEERYSADERTKTNWYYFSNLSLTMQEARKYCFDLFPGMIKMINNDIDLSLKYYLVVLK